MWHKLWSMGPVTFHPFDILTILTHPCLPDGVAECPMFSLAATMLGVDTDLWRPAPPRATPPGPGATPMLSWCCLDWGWPLGADVSDTVSSSLSPVLTLGLLALPGLCLPGLWPPWPRWWPLLCWEGLSWPPETPGGCVWSPVSPASSPLSTMRLGHEDESLASTLCLSWSGGQRSPSLIRWIESWISASWHISASAIENVVRNVEFRLLKWLWFVWCNAILEVLTIPIMKSSCLCTHEQRERARMGRCALRARYLGRNKGPLFQYS